MATLLVGLNPAKRKIAYCSSCHNQIYAPSNNVLYTCCYNCGAKFDKQYSARDIKEAINSQEVVEQTNKKIIKKVFNFELRGTENQLKEMYDLWNREDFYNPKFKKYFLCWVNYGTGIYAFPRKQYFVSKNGNTNWEELYNEIHNEDSVDKWD